MSTGLSENEGCGTPNLLRCAQSSHNERQMECAREVTNYTRNK